MNYLGMHGFSCASVVNNLKDRKFFPSNEYSNGFDPFLLGVTGIVPPYRIEVALILL